MSTDTLSPEIVYITEQMERGFHLIPQHMQGGIKRYILNGIPPGGFLTALLSNDFMGAMGKADDENQRALVGWARFLYNHVPCGTFGSPAEFQAWLDEGGAIGRAAEAA